jgi:peptidoglycan/LPS O-acetylase OafA/YrhL
MEQANSNPDYPAGIGETSQEIKPKYFPCFNGLRAIAAISVLIFHVSASTGFTLRSPLGTYLGRLEVGVPIFFLISGFLLYRPFALSHISFEELPNRRRFWERRILRIIPAYWLALTLLAYVFHLINLGPGWEGPVANYLFLQIYFPKTSITGIIPSWSLCVEMSFYLLLPLYASLVRSKVRNVRRQVKLELIGIVVLIFASLIYRWWLFNEPILKMVNGHLVSACAPNCMSDPLWSSVMSVWLPSRLDLFALGMLLAVVSVWLTKEDLKVPFLDSRIMPWLSWLLAATAYFWVCHIGVSITAWAVVPPVTNIEKQALYGVTAFFILLPAVFGPSNQSIIRRFLRFWPVAAVGAISYGIYLWHCSAADWYIRQMNYPPNDSPFLKVLLATILITFFVASLSYFLLERPILKYKDKLLWWNRVPGPIAGTQAVEQT